VNGVTTEFTYDSRNRVVRRTSGNGTLNLTYSGWHLIEERNASGTLEQVYVHGAGIDEILVKITPTGPAYYHHDGLGSTIALTGENGELLESYRYDAFGAASVYDSSASALPASPRGNRFLFTGREWLGQAGIYDYRNRVYSAQIGRFLQTDPIRFSAGDVNIYRYCENDPVNLWDPYGLMNEGDPGSMSWCAEKCLKLCECSASPNNCFTKCFDNCWEGNPSPLGPIAPPPIGPLPLPTPTNIMQAIGEVISAGYEWITGK
jgi:RHS repeat-associated protein